MSIFSLGSVKNGASSWRIPTAVLCLALSPSLCGQTSKQTVAFHINEVKVLPRDSGTGPVPTVTKSGNSVTLTDGVATLTLTAPSGPFTGTEFSSTSTVALDNPANFQVTTSFTSDGVVVFSMADPFQAPVCLPDVEVQLTPKAPNTTCTQQQFAIFSSTDRGEPAGGPRLLEQDFFVDFYTSSARAVQVYIYYDYAAPATCADVGFDYMEVVQVVQDTMNSIPLVAGKPTVARAFLKINNPPQQPVTGITGVLRRMVGGNDSGDPPRPNFPGPMVVQNVVQRDQINQSLNFELPPEWTTLGKIDLQAEANAPACTGTTTTIKITGGASVEFKNVRAAGRTTFSVAWIPFRYAVGGTPVECASHQPTCPDESLIPAYDYFIKKFYPIAPDNVAWFPLDIPPPAPIEPLRGVVPESAFLNQVRKTYLAAEAKYFDHLVAVIPEPVTLPGTQPSDYGLAESIPGRVAHIEQTHVGNGFDNLNDTANQTHFNSYILAHELGHLLGRHHTNQKTCTFNGDRETSNDTNTDWPYATADIQEIGFDVASKKVIPANYGDVMSYCGYNTPTWISPFTYNQLIKVGLDAKIAGATSLYTNPRAVAAPAANAQAIVSGSARSDGTAGTLDPVYQVVSGDTPAVSQNGGTYCLHFSGSSGALGDFCFNLSFVNIESGAPLDTQHFAFKVQLPGGTTRISLVTGGKELAALTAKSQPPSLTIASPQTGEQWTTGQHTITWSGSDPAGGRLLYSVLYSSDGRQSWLPMNMDITDTQFTFDPSQIKGGPNVFFRVMASSGLNSTSVDVGPVNVVQTPAIAASTGKLNFAIQAIGDSPTQTVTLSNTGSGPLTVSSFQIDNAAFQIVAPSTPLKIRAGSSAVVTVQWVSIAPGPVNGNLSISSDDPATKSLTVSLGGIGPVSGGGITVTPTSLDFGVVAVGQRSPAQNVTIKNTGTAAVSLTLSTIAPFAVSPSSVSVPGNGGTATVAITFAPATAAAATGTLFITSGSQSSLVGFVSLTGLGGTPGIGGTTTPVITGIANAASFLPKLAPGSLGTIFGSNLTSSAPTSAPSLPLPTSLNGVSVTVGGVRAPLIYVSAGQINFQMPYEIPAGNSAAVIVTSNGTPSSSMTATIADYAVGIFTYARTAQALDPIIVHNATNALITPSSPAVPNEFLIVYATGVGKVNNAPATGTGTTGLASAVDIPSITIGGVAAKVLYSGLTPGFPGLVQFNVQLPATLPSGSLPLVIAFPGDASPPVNLAVQGNATASPKLSLSTTSLAFGSVPIGQKKDLSVVVTNTGGGSLVVNSAAVTGAGFTLTTASSFTVTPGASQQVTVRYTPASATSASGTLTIASNDPSQSSATIALSGTGAVAATVTMSDTFNRANATTCSLGQADLALGGSGTHFYLPIFPGASGPIGANIVSGALQNNGQDFGGVQLTSSAGACTNSAIRGESLSQNLNISVDLLVPKTGSNVTLAGPFFRSRAAAAGDGIVGGSSAGYWVQLVSTGEVRIQGLNPNAVIATTGPATSFDSTAIHTLQIAAQGLTLQVALDGNVLTFTQNGTAATTIALPSSNGSDDGAVGIAFGAPDNRGLAGGQRAKNLVITSYTALVH